MMLESMLACDVGEYAACDESMLACDVREYAACDVMLLRVYYAGL